MGAFEYGWWFHKARCSYLLTSAADAFLERGVSGAQTVVEEHCGTHRKQLPAIIDRVCQRPPAVPLNVYSPTRSTTVLPWCRAYRERHCTTSQCCNGTVEIWDHRPFDPVSAPHNHRLLHDIAGLNYVYTIAVVVLLKLRQ